MYAILDDLKQAGLVKHVDFDYAYHAPTFDYFTNEGSERSVDLIFYNLKYASFYALKYS
jgi:hypothetical protein